jgi:hypothetical protein
LKKVLENKQMKKRKKKKIIIKQLTFLPGGLEACPCRPALLPPALGPKKTKAAAPLSFRARDRVGRPKIADACALLPLAVADRWDPHVSRFLFLLP